MIDKWNSFDYETKLLVIRKLVTYLRLTLGPSADARLIKKIGGMDMNYNPEFMSMLEDELIAQHLI